MSAPPSEFEPPRKVENSSAEPVGFSSAMIASPPPLKVVSGAPARDREVGRVRAAGEPGVAGRVEDEAAGRVEVRAADEGREDERRAGRVQLRDERVAVVVGRVVRAGGGREVRRRRAAAHVGVAGAVDGEAAAAVEVGAAEEGGVDERRAGRVQLRQGGVEGAVGGGVEGARAWSGSRWSWRSPARTRCRRRRPGPARRCRRPCRRGTSSTPSAEPVGFSLVTNTSYSPRRVRRERAGGGREVARDSVSPVT